MNQKTRSICNYYQSRNCRVSCILAKSCVPQLGDDAAKFADRMNAASAKLKFKGFQ